MLREYLKIVFRFSLQMMLPLFLKILCQLSATLISNKFRTAMQLSAICSSSHGPEATDRCGIDLLGTTERSVAKLHPPPRSQNTVHYTSCLPHASIFIIDGTVQILSFTEITLFSHGGIPHLSLENVFAYFTPVNSTLGIHTRPSSRRFQYLCFQHIRFSKTVAGGAVLKHRRTAIETQAEQLRALRVCSRRLAST